MKRMTVAVDGPAGSGKSSVSRHVAAQLGFRYIDSGAIYRAITLFVLSRDGSVGPDFRFTPDIAEAKISQEFLPDRTCRTYLNGTDVSIRLRDEKITGSIGIISDCRPVREHVNQLLRAWARESSVIMDGRDIGSVVFPCADLKIYLDASPEVRARRRINEYRELGKNVDEILIKKQIILRDEQDARRPFGALVRVPDALSIDTSRMTMDQVIERISQEIINRMERHGAPHPGNE
ncbi:MAG: (d)CMP kinase [Spirochaetes bacterium]|nr:(d)CMP kinase [Spirochaetota bacterium]